MKNLKCEKCGFVIKEQLKTCPLCHAKTVQTKEEAMYEVNLPKTLPSRDGEVGFDYICYKCKRKTVNQICLHCNLPTFLSVEYHKKRAVIQRIEELSDVFSQEEIDCLLQDLSMQEKAWIYYHFANSNRFFYKKDKTKAFTLFFVAALMYYLCLSIALEVTKEMLFVSYFINGFANATFTTFFALGIGYLIDASVVEYKKLAGLVGIISAMISLVQVVVAIFFTFDVKWMLMSGFIGIGIGILVNIIITLVMRDCK